MADKLILSDLACDSKSLFMLTLVGFLGAFKLKVCCMVVPLVAELLILNARAVWA